MANLAEYVDGLLNICGSEERIRQAIRASRTTPVFLPQGTKGFSEVNSAFAIALHMHQPLIPAGGPELRTAQLPRFRPKSPCLTLVQDDLDVTVGQQRAKATAHVASPGMCTSQADALHALVR